ncbi:hypothetical protein DCCM_2448 [Desulfocucumis palustris]|uniref:Uncharacterized protein n=1 Tax=Desulfocucumis palustris TaxID=1898651 RepID=A0A2L2XAP9_9FIRM|nr:hypothetical protein DCCM_2448 [Desulfocucumis palustris]
MGVKNERMSENRAEKVYFLTRFSSFFVDDIGIFEDDTQKH